MYQYEQKKVVVVSREDVGERIQEWINKTRAPKQVKIERFGNSDYELTLINIEDGVTA